LAFPGLGSFRAGFSDESTQKLEKSSLKCNLDLHAGVLNQ